MKEFWEKAKQDKMNHFTKNSKTLFVFIGIGAAAVFLMFLALRFIGKTTKEPPKKYVKEDETQSYQSAVDKYQSFIDQLKHYEGEMAVFTNPTYGYTVAYPPVMPVGARSSGEVDFGMFAWEPAPGFVTIAAHKDKGIDIVAKEFKDTYYNCKEDVAVEPALKIGGLPTWKMTCEEAFAGNEYIHFFVENGADTYALTYMNGYDEALNKIFEQMIYSLSF